MSRFLSGVLAAVILVVGGWLYLGSQSPEPLGGAPEDLAEPVDPVDEDIEPCIAVEERVAKMWGQEAAEKLGRQLRGKEPGAKPIDRERLRTLCIESNKLEDAEFARRARALEKGDYEFKTVN